MKFVTAICICLVICVVFAEDDQKKAVNDVSKDFEKFLFFTLKFSL